ncbi:type VII toxin-antitoxin system MntA family adenylyltransferase antitoxin [Dethiobacter alkaliphilus]|uniref:type VII toxin-antitoxin system MntA family adenylyltransferase antitoxin n=1 Tax=Dethiobacter alkaliphilus TaxID=427926 RepID=UPI002226532B|nr:nucleotidyltransferase domain-containing protein [Dethiobacter alkaliphilus]MCW3490013.1 nucleotidyltransferase domain-containing protein [Dethiobacter alkaliphilus]
MEKEKLIEKIQVLLKNEEHVIFAYIFGSVATGKNRNNSDVDIAVCFSPELTKLERFDLRLKVTDQLALALSSDVDLVDLSSAPLSLLHQIMRDGILIFERSKSARVAFEVSSRREYFDFARHLDRRADAIISRM